MKVKRTRRHVVVWLTTEQAKSLQKLTKGQALTGRQGKQMRQIAEEAYTAAITNPPPKPNRTSLRTREEGLQLRKGTTI